MAKGPEFKDKFTKKFNAEIQLYAPNVYDAVMVMADSMKRANSVDPAKYLEAVGKTSYEGVTAKIEFDDKGDLKGGAISIYQYKGGKLEYVDTLGGGVVGRQEAAAATGEAAKAVAGAATEAAKDATKGCRRRSEGCCRRYQGSGREEVKGYNSPSQHGNGALGAVSASNSLFLQHGHPTSSRSSMASCGAPSTRWWHSATRWSTASWG